MTREIRWMMSLLQISLLALFTACEGGGGGSDDPTVDVTGIWTGSLVMLGESQTLRLSLVQNGSEVSGSDQDNSTFTGTVDGNTLYLTSEARESNGYGKLEVEGPVVSNSMSLTGSVYVESTDGRTASGPATFNASR